MHWHISDANWLIAVLLYLTSPVWEESDIRPRAANRLGVDGEMGLDTGNHSVSAWANDPERYRSIDGR